MPTKEEALVGVVNSHEEPVFQSLQFLLLGLPDSGKSFVAMTASKKWKGWRDKKWTPEDGELILLDDLFVIGFDKKPVAGLREQGYSVPLFNVHAFRSNEDTWKKAGFKKRPTVKQAFEQACTAASVLKPDWLIIDTVTAFDAELVAYWNNRMPEEKEKQRMFGNIATDHQDTYDMASMVAPGLITIFHTHVPITAMDSSEQSKRRETLSTASGGTIIPAITGKGARKYKGDNSLQFAVTAKVKGSGEKRKIERKLELASFDYETKNRFSLSLDAVMEPRLDKVLERISA